MAEITKHTPGPVHVVTEGGGVTYLKDDQDRYLAALNALQDGISRNQSAANATFIVRAWNSHDELLDILRVAIARIEIANNDGDDILSAWLSDARAAIAKAEG